MRIPMQGWIALGALACSTTSFAQALPNDPAARLDEFARCAAIDEPSARHACSDEVMRRAGMLDDARVTRQLRRDFGSEGPARETRAAAPAEAATRAPAQPNIDELATRVAAVRMHGQRLIVTTVEGSSWEQVQSESFRALPKAGDSFSITRAALGSFRCSFGRSSVYRCRRLD